MQQLKNDEHHAAQTECPEHDGVAVKQVGLYYPI